MRPDKVELPWDTSLSPGAYLSTGWAWLVRPRRSSRTYASVGSRPRAVLFAALTLTLSFFAASTVRDIISPPAGEQERLTPPLSIARDLVEWQAHWFYALVLLAACSLLLDWLLLRTRSAPGALVRAWAFGLSVAWMQWLTVPLAWAAGLLAMSASPQQQIAGALLAYLVFAATAALVPVWFWLRWWLLRWAAGPSRVTKAATLLAPWVPVCLVLALDSR